MFSTPLPDSMKYNGNYEERSEMEIFRVLRFTIHSLEMLSSVMSSVLFFLGLVLLSVCSLGSHKNGMKLTEDGE